MPAVTETLTPAQLAEIRKLVEDTGFLPMTNKADRLFAAAAKNPTLKEFYGRGPTRAKSYYQDDRGVCVLRGGFSRVEQTLLEGGRGPAVIQQRMEFQEVMRQRFADVVEKATGRPVIGFMSGNQQHPDLMCEVFVLGPTDLVDDRDRLPGQPGELGLQRGLVALRDEHVVSAAGVQPVGVGVLGVQRIL